MRIDDEIFHGMAGLIRPTDGTDISYDMDLAKDYAGYMVGEIAKGTISF